MDKRVISAIVLLAWALTPILAQTQSQPQTEQKNPAPPAASRVGKVFFPGDFVHGEKNFTKGLFEVYLTEKEDWPYFQVYSMKKELLFEEMAIVKSLARKQSRRKIIGVLKGNEYFRIMLIRGDQAILGYFLLKPKAPAAAKEPEKKEK